MQEIRHVILKQSSNMLHKEVPLFFYEIKKVIHFSKLAIFIKQSGGFGPNFKTGQTSWMDFIVESQDGRENDKSVVKQDLNVQNLLDLNN